ncbi:MAG: hypothetical protein Q7V20_14505 [Aquabacterium sp.]|uniref:hypothetical protein n=1 Tax=Aquabacterium sp. TaxID=1872578 RepID=UPI0027263322|nr:hypothetical protein [Aquabacterium sp.]MDO9004655.1 hypothetical protein [Aquabacterium sp.]
MKRLCTVLAVFAIGHSVQPCHAADRTDSAIFQAVSEGRYLDADRLARRRLQEVIDKPDFKSSDVTTRYLQAINTAQKWARWHEAEHLLATLERGLHKVETPGSNSIWLDLHTQQIELFSEMDSYSLADAAYATARSKAAKHKLDDGPSFNALLAAQADSLRRQERWWEASLVLEERLNWLKRFEPGNQLASGEVLTELGEVNLSMERMEESNRRFTQAKPLLESAYRHYEKDRAAAIQAMSNWAFSAYRLDRPGWDHCVLRSQLIDALESTRGRSSPLLVTPLIEAAAYCEDELGNSNASKMYERALKIATDTWGEAHPQVLDVLNMQGTFLASREDSESMNEKGHRILKSELELRRRTYAEAPLVKLSTDVRRMSDDPSDTCTGFSSGHCKAEILESLTSLSRVWGEQHPALAVLRTYMVVRIGGFSSSAATDQDDAARYAFVTEQCETAFVGTLASYVSGNPQTAQIAKACANLAWSLRKMKDVERYLSHAAKIYVKYFGEEEMVSKETVALLSSARLILDKK